MSLTLAIDCSLRWLNLGLAEGTRAIGERNSDFARGQAESLPGEVELFLAEQAVALDDLADIAVTIGPGYYTGTRIGVAYACGLAEALGLRIKPVSSLYALSHDLVASGLPVASLIRANRRGLYGALFAEERELFSGYYSPSSFADLVRDRGKQPLVVAADSCPWQEISDLAAGVIARVPSIGLAVAQAASEVEAIDPAQIRISYFRDPD